MWGGVDSLKLIDKCVMRDKGAPLLSYVSKVRHMILIEVIVKRVCSNLHGLSQCGLSHQFIETGRVSAPKLTDLYCTTSVSTSKESFDPTRAEPVSTKRWRAGTGLPRLQETATP